MYRSFNQAMTERFGQKVYKLTLDGGMSCPNRDGHIDTRGCVFCSDVGSGEFAAPVCQDIHTQLDHAKTRVEKKNKGGAYIAYFQSFTNTHAPLAHLRQIFQAALEPSDVVALSIATRPDCLPPQKVALLQELNRKKPVWVELGLQTIHPQTARYLRRGYELDCYDDCATRLKAAGLEVIVHMILGLPGENRQQMVETARYIGQSGVHGIKLQLLHVLEGTDMAQDYANGHFAVLSLEDYAAALMDCIRVLPPELVIHRLTGDGPKSKLIAPLWSADKKQVLNYLQRCFQQANLQQGSLLRA